MRMGSWPASERGGRARGWGDGEAVRCGGGGDQPGGGLFPSVHLAVPFVHET